jgi:hypothetical protein
MSYDKNITNEVICFLVGYMLCFSVIQISISIASIYMNPELNPLNYDYVSITQQLLC